MFLSVTSFEGPHHTREKRVSLPFLILKRIIRHIRGLNKINLVKLGYGGLVLGTRQLLQLPQRPQKLCYLQKWSKVTCKS